MSINANPWQGGGAASVPDASETVRGIIRIATSAEATTGTDDLTAMTPLTVKERIDAALVGGVEYKGEYTGQSLVTAQQGDMYISSGSQTLGGVSLSNGDHIIFNEDAADPVLSSMFDVIDNTETPASETVAGVIEIATNAEATAASATDKALVPSNISSIDLSSFDNDLSADDFAADHTAVNYTPANANIDGHLSGIDDELLLKAPLASPSLTGTPTAPTATQGDNSTKLATTAYVDTAVSGAGGNQITDVSSQTASSFTATANEIYVCGYSTGTQTITFPDASSSTDGDLIGLSSVTTTEFTVDLVSSDGTTNDLLNVDNQTKGGTNGAITLTLKQELILFACDGTRWRQLSRELADVAKTGAYSDLSGTPTLATVATTGAYSDLSGTPTLGTAAALDVGTGANNVVQLDGSSRLPAVDGSQLTNLPSGASDLDGLSDVTITSASSGQILRNNGSGQFVNVALSIVDDTSPQLGGALDVNGNAITSASNGDVTINPDGTGDISVGADIIPDADATHTLGSEDNRFITLHSELNGAVQFKARNETGGALTKGQAVYISGVSGDVPLVSLARANSASTMPAHGLLAADVSNNADVQVISFGNLTAYDTTTHSLSLGDTVYVSAATAGALTNSAPASETNLIQNIGKVVRASATEGIIKVGGAGRSAATPNLDQDKIFLGNASNQAVSTALSSINLTSFNDDLGSTYQPLDAQLTDVAGLTPADGAFIVGDGANFVTESGATARTSLGAIAEISEDSSPQLGGSLDTNQQQIVTLSNRNIQLSPNGTGVVELRGNQDAGGTNSGALLFQCEQNTHGVYLRAPLHSAAANLDLRLPSSDGSSGDALVTDGSGNLSFTTISGGGGGGGFTYSAVTSATTAQVNYHYSCGAGNQSFTVTLPAASSSTGQVSVKNMGTGTITVGRTGADTIDGTAANHTIDTQYTALTFISNGSNGWEIR